MMRKGFTLTEAVLASSLLCFVSLGLFEGIITASKIAHENSEFLAADALAWDVAWKRFNEPYANLTESLRPYSNPIVETVSTSNGKEKSAAPVLWYGSGSPAKVYTVISNGVYRINGYEQQGVLISVNVEWGPAKDRRSLAPIRNKTTRHFGHQVEIFRGTMERGN